MNIIVTGSTHLFRWPGAATRGMRQNPGDHLVAVGVVEDEEALAVPRRGFITRELGGSTGPA